MLRASLISLIALGVVAQEPAKTTPKAKAKPKAGKVDASTPSGKSPVLARVGDQTITEDDFQAAFSLLGQQEQMSILMVQGGKDEFVKRMAEAKLLSVKAKRLGLDKTPSYQRGLDRAKDDLLAREFLTKEGEGLQKKLVVSEADVKAFYEKHPDKFKQPDLVSVRHILITVKQGEGQPGLSDEEAKAKIAKVQEELKAGAKFEELAKKYSDDPGSKENGGLYADADPSGWVPEFGNAARTQVVGEVGSPVKTQFGYHLMKVEDRKPSRVIPFEEAKQAAEKRAQQERQTIVWNELMDSLRKEIPFEMIKPVVPTSKVATPTSTPEPAKTPEPGKAPESPKGGAQ